LKRPPVPIVDGHGADSHQDLFILGDGSGHVPHLEDIGRSISGEYDGFQLVPIAHYTLIDKGLKTVQVLRS
jgi:hypothetical protein